MIKSYLFIEKGPLKQKIFPLGERKSIGRGGENHICLLHATVSRQHAIYYIEDGHSIVEDLGSSGGTFVNGERINKSELTSGDTLLIGSVGLRFFQGEESWGHSHLTEAPELNRADTSACLNSNSLLNQYRRLVQAISKASFFARLNKKDLDRLCPMKNLLLFEQDSTIVRQGDRGRSLYIILDGRVQVITSDNLGKEILVSFLTANQFFGELSFLSGVPRMATVQALEETLVCKLRLESIRETMNNSPEFREVMEECCQDSLKYLEEKKREAGFLERRKQPRFNISLPVEFRFPSDPEIPDGLAGSLVHGFSSQISGSGIRINARDQSLLNLLINSTIILTINLPKSKEGIHCLGTLKRVSEGKGDVSAVILDIEFSEMSSTHQKNLKNFLSD